MIVFKRVNFKYILGEFIMKKKLFTLFLLSFLISSLSGCQSPKESQTSSATQESESISTQEPSKEEKTTVSSESNLTQASVDNELSISESTYFRMKI